MFFAFKSEEEVGNLQKGSTFRDKHHIWCNMGECNCIQLYPNEGIVKKFNPNQKVLAVKIQNGMIDEDTAIN